MGLTQQLRVCKYNKKTIFIVFFFLFFVNVACTVVSFLALTQTMCLLYFFYLWLHVYNVLLLLLLFLLSFMQLCTQAFVFDSFYFLVDFLFLFFLFNIFPLCFFGIKITPTNDDNKQKKIIIMIPTATTIIIINVNRWIWKL